MPTDLALVDFFRPYILKGENTDWHAALSVIYVESFETALSDEGITIRGVARFSGEGKLAFDPLAGKLSFEGSNKEGHPQQQAGRREPWLDITDTRLEFALSAPRAAGAIISAGLATIPASETAFDPVREVLNVWDDIPADAPPSDYPGTAFSLQLVLAGIVLRPPFLKPAKMTAEGLLQPDTSLKDVTFNLPKIKLLLSQGSDAQAKLEVSLQSLGVASLDDVGDIGAAEMISMTPPYALIGDSGVVGFGFKSAVLDLSDGYTPPAILEQFGFDESWTGLYLPEIRLFVAPHGMEDFAVNAGVRNLLIGLGDSSGITGDFEVMVVNQGAGSLGLQVVFLTPDGRVIGVSPLADGSIEVALPEHSRLLIEVSGGKAPYLAKATFGGSDHNGLVHDIDLSSSTELNITVNARDASTPQKNQTLTIKAYKQSAAAPASSSATVTAPASVKTTSITLDNVAQTTPALMLVQQDSSSITISLDPPSANTTWKIGSNPTQTSAMVTIPLAAGETKAVEAALSNGTVNNITCYFRFDQPGSSAPTSFAIDYNNTNSSPAVDPSSSTYWMPPAIPFMDKFRQALKQINVSSLTLVGTASYENNDAKDKYNYLLSRRRAEALKQLLTSEANHPDSNQRIPSFTLTTSPPDIGAEAPPTSWVTDWKTHSSPRNLWWKASIEGFSAITIPGSITKGEVTRPAVTQPVEPPPALVTPPAPPPAPDWFRAIALKVRIVRDQFVAVELSGELDFETGAEEKLRNRGVGSGDIPSFEGLGSQNPSDGIVKYLILYQTDPASQTDQIKLYLGADPNDKDGLLMTGQLPGQPLKPKSTGRNVLGMTALFTPLIAETAPASPTDGSVAEIVLTAAALGLPIALAELGFFNIERVVLFGGELNVVNRAGQWVSTLLFDVETAISADIELGGIRFLEIPREKPLAVRYKAIGLKMGYPAGSSDRFQLRPMFDASKGFSIDLSGPGAVKVPDPLGQILQVLGARIARTNPLTFEIDLGFAIDLGVVTIERARVRLPVSPLGPPELTAFAASISVPSTIEGRGYLEINNENHEFKGQIDVSLVPLKLRLAAGLGIADIPASKGGPATGVIITLELELPVAIPLAQSGFGIYGFLGLFAMHYARDESGINSLTPALAWLKDRAKGNPTNVDAWKPEVNKWGFGLGAILGTMEGGIIFNVKGMVLLELPGPRLLLIMRANLLAVLPDLKDGEAEGTFLCVIDLDFGRGRLTIGLSIDFKVTPLVEIQIPVEAYFNLTQGGDWHVYLGTMPGNDQLGRPLPGPIHANILQVFDGSGYVMISGHGIPAYKGLDPIHGVGLAVGLEVSILWGNRSINLYLRATAGLNAVLGFEPFYVGGLLYVRGELRLFVVSISASAQLTVQIGEKADGSKLARIDGEICGEVDLFFFTVKGCVDFHLGVKTEITPPAPELVRTATLVGRSPALVVGTGVDKGIDSKLGDGLRQATPPALNDEKLITVPIDAIPLLTMSAIPVIDGLQILGESSTNSPGGAADGFIQRGDYAYRYVLTSVELARADGGEVTGPGPRPSTWWTLNDPSAGNLITQLSLLNWTPNATPKAVERSKFLEQTVKERWGTVCHDAAPAAAVLWTFEDEPTGPSDTGWLVDGIAWPDPDESKRSAPPELEIKVWERWRSGDRQLDRLRGIVPAVISPGNVPCYVPKRSKLNPKLKEVALKKTGYNARLELEREALTAATAASVGLRKADRSDVPGLQVHELLQQIASGQPVHRASLQPSALSHPPSSKTACNSRLLASPHFDLGIPIVFGDQNRSKEVEERLEKLGRGMDEFCDVLVIDCGAIIDGWILLLLHNNLDKQEGSHSLIVRYLDASGNELNRRPVTDYDLLQSVGIPPKWNDQNGPWARPIYHVLAHAQQLGRQYTPYLVKVKTSRDVRQIQIAVLQKNPDRSVRMKHEQLGRPYYVAALEFTSMGEASREDWDTEQTQRNREVLETFLGKQSGDIALLVPDKLYRLSTKVEVTTRDKAGNLSGPEPQTADFWFKTDNLSPRSLEPWMLCSLPAADEQHYFGAEYIKIVFATQDVDKLWAAYGKELRARLKAASYRQVQVPGLVHPVPLVRQKAEGSIQPVLQNIPASVLSPFEGALVDGLKDYGTCIPVDGKRTRHSSFTLPIPLDPYTDYVLDIEAVPIGAAQNTVGERVLRRHFSTGAFASFDAFATSFQGVLTEHRHAPSNAIATIAASFASRQPQGAELDQAMINAGLEPMPVPQSPRIVVLWEQANPASQPQPVAVLIDASEPMLRSRKLPEVEFSQDNPPTQRWKMLDQTWLELLADSANSATISSTIWAPGKQRALVVLAANARGKRLKLNLQKKAQTAVYLDGESASDKTFAIVDEMLSRAPWEEV